MNHTGSLESSSHLRVERVPVGGGELSPGLLQLLQPVHPPLAVARREDVLAGPGAARNK